MSTHEGRPTEVLILGVHHWNGDVPDSAIATLREKVRAWNPDAVAIERLSTAMWCWMHELDEDPQQADLANIQSAEDAAAAIAGEHDWPLLQARQIALDPSASPDDRVKAWIACYEPENALLHTDGAQLTGEVARVVEVYQAMPSERVRLGAWLGRELGHERLWFCDDFTHEEWTPELTRAVQEFYYPPLSERIAKVEAHVAAAVEAGDVWPLYLQFNSPEGFDQSEELENDTWLVDAPEDIAPLGRLRLSQWRARNLHMAANLRAVTGHFPGGRVLMIVGFAHARPMRAALSTDQHDLRLVDVAELD